MAWLIINSYRANRKKYLYAILSLILTTFLATVSIGALDFAASLWKTQILQSLGGHILVHPAEGMLGLFEPTRVFDADQARRIIAEVFPEASTTSLLIAPARYINDPNVKVRLNALPRMRNIVGRSDNIDSWYLFHKSTSGMPLSSVEPDDPALVVQTAYESTAAGLMHPDATFRIARYVTAEDPWEISDVEPVTLRVAGTCQTSDQIYMRIEALRAITGCPDNIVSMIAIALPGLQAKPSGRKLEQLRKRLSEEMPELGVLTAEDIGRAFLSDIKVLDEAPRTYLPLVYGISFTILAAIVTSIANSRRHELRLLHTIGLSRVQVRLLFAMESIIASLVAGLIGYLPIVMLARIALKTGQVSVLSVIITLLGAIVIGVSRSMLLLRGPEGMSQ